MRFTQVKIHAREPETLAQFYVDALGCEVIRPLTPLEEPAPSAVGPSAAAVSILVVALPGLDDGPTLELLAIDGHVPGSGFEPGNACLTFLVDDVDRAASEIVEAGGSFRGEIVEFTGPSGPKFRFVFMNDPEGNVIDLFTKVGD